MTATLLETNYLECDLETCPVHAHGELKREYTFGMQDCTVSTYSCGCAVVTSEETNIEGKGYHYKNYANACGMARMIKARKASR